MILKDKLYHITGTEHSASAPTYTITWQPDHVIYRAHFPEKPITPGVCIIQIAQELLDEHTQSHFIVQQVKNVKFLNVISPLETPSVQYVFDKISIADDTGACRLQVRVLSQQMVYAKLSLICKRATA